MLRNVEVFLVFYLVKRYKGIIILVSIVSVVYILGLIIIRVIVRRIDVVGNLYE